MDGLRGLAILLVLSFHFLWFAEGDGLFRIGDDPLRQWLVALQYAGWVGVDLFFALSGFLITGILADTKDRPGYFRSFYGRRVLRIFPAYYLMLGVWMLLRRWLPVPMTSASDPDYPAWLFGYASNMQLALHGWLSVPVPMRHLWSLAIEEQFYLLWPLMIFCLDRRRAILACIGLVLLAPLLRLWFVSHPVATDGDFLLMPCRLDVLAAGSLLALLIRTVAPFTLLIRFACAAAMVALALLAMLFIARRGFESSDYLVSVVGMLVLAVLFASSVLLASTKQMPSPLQGLLEGSSLRWLGKYSYGLYLWHQPVCVLLYASGFMALLARSYALRWPWLFILLIYATPMIASAAIAWLSWHCCEEPLLRLKSRFPTTGQDAATRLQELP